MKQLIYSIFLISSFFSAYSETSPYNAARRGDLDTLRLYRFEGIDLFVPDERGFIPYELAALHADPEKANTLRKHVEVMLWLKEYQAKKHQYGKASIALVQAGLNALGYPVGKPDGIMGRKTADAIRAYQTDNELAQTGRLGPQWLGLFYQDILKDMQFKLTKLGFDTKGTDGIMGRNTRNAMLKYRKNKQLSNPDYPYLDALLLSSIDGRYVINEKKLKAAVAKQARMAAENKVRFAQAGLRTLGHRIGKVDGMLGSKTTNGIKKFQKRYKLPVTGDIDDKTQAKMDSIFLKETQRKLNFLGYSVGKPDGKMGKKSAAAFAKYRKHNQLSGTGLTAALIAEIDDSFDIATEKVASKKAAAKREAAKNRAKRQAAAKARKQQNKKTTQKSTKVAVKKNTQNRKQTTIKPTKKRPSQDIVTKKSKPSTMIVPKTTNKKTTAIKGNQAKGRMRFNRKSGRVVGCSIAGRGIPIEWCEPFYPLPKKNHCEATFKPSSGVVINLWCK